MGDEIKEAAPSYEDLLRLPDHLVGEIVGGELHVSPRPAAAHARASSVLGTEVTGPFDRGRGGPGGWWILDEPELHLQSDVLVPDLAGWRRKRMPRIPDVAHFDLAPDWVCEVVSPRTARLDRTRKVPAYARSGVSFLWLVDPAAKTLEVFRLREGAWQLEATHGGSEAVRAIPFDAIELDLAALWLEE
ncbi:MAG TPA: Uma2 family endonuclease [Thermoanaerobaculia bacterium]|nr:Uma2 family endonuclease [Thermoanaerobaculia bacterium]